MDINEIRMKRDALQRSFGIQLQQFEEDTGCEIMRNSLAYRVVEDIEDNSYVTVPLVSFEVGIGYAPGPFAKAAKV